MIIKRKIHKIRIRTFIKTNGILQTSRCTAMKEKLHCGPFFGGAKFV